MRRTISTNWFAARLTLFHGAWVSSHAEFIGTSITTLVSQTFAERLALPWDILWIHCTDTWLAKYAFTIHALAARAWCDPYRGML